MTETLLGLVTLYGAWMVGLAAFLSCLLVPIPTSVLMLSAGAFAASGDLDAATLWLTVLAGALLGDQAGYWIGRLVGEPVLSRLANTPAKADLARKARHTVSRWGGLGVFFSTWLFAPLGPWVNFIAGATRLGWPRFALWDSLGEMIWVTAYLGLGFTFSDQIAEMAQLVESSLGFIVAGLVTLGLGWMLFRAARAPRRH